MTCYPGPPYRPPDDGYLASDAVISEDGQYRYVLNRRWNQALPVMPWIGLNPSTADGHADDQTVRQMCWFARRESCGGICLLNLYALRSANPAALRSHPDPAGPENDKWIAGLGELAAMAWILDGENPVPVMAAWGAHPLAAARLPRARELLRGMPMTCLGTTQAGAPRHPCRLGHAAAVTPYEWQEAPR